MESKSIKSDQSSQHSKILNRMKIRCLIYFHIVFSPVVFYPGAVKCQTTLMKFYFIKLLKIMYQTWLIHFPKFIYCYSIMLREI